MTIYGWDASHYDGVPTAGQVVAAGMKFATHKAGGDATDAKLGAWWSALKGTRGKVLLGAYWVLRPDLTSSASASADAFVARLDAVCGGWRDGPFILQADCEIWNGSSSTRPSKSYIKTFCDRLVTKTPKLRPIVYASQGQYGDTLSGLGHPLWNANYPVSTKGSAGLIYDRAGGDSGKGWSGYSGQTPAIWQFTSSATIAGQTTCDADAYRGTTAELTKLVAPGWETDVAISSSDLTNIAQAVASKLHTDLTTASSGLAKDQAASEQRIIKAVTVDPAAIAADVLAGLDPTKIAAAIPTDMAQQVVDILVQRLQS